MANSRRTRPANATKKAGKFWVYEQAIRIPFYAIYEVRKSAVEVYHLVDGQYQLMQPNDRNHYAIATMGVELGILMGTEEIPIPWLRWWDANGDLLLTGDERAVRAEAIANRERQEKLHEIQRADRAEQKAQRLAEKLKALGIDPDEI